MNLRIRGAAGGRVTVGDGLVTKSVLAPGQAGRLYELLRAALPVGTELVINQALRVGAVTATVREYGGPVRAERTYDRAAIETLGDVWADRAAADLKTLLTPAGGS